MGIFERLILVIGSGWRQVAVHNFRRHARFKAPPAEVFALVELKQTLHLVLSAPLQDAQYTEISYVTYAIFALALDHCAKHLIEDKRDSLLEIGRLLPLAHDHHITSPKIRIPYRSVRHAGARLQERHTTTPLRHYERSAARSGHLPGDRPAPPGGSKPR